MKATDRAAWAVVLGALLLFALALTLPSGWKSDFFSRYAAKRLDRAEPDERSAVRLPVRFPVPERYIRATRAQVAKRMAEPDWAGLTLDARREILLEIFLLSGVDAAYWSLPEARQRQVAEAYWQAFLKKGTEAGGANASGGQHALPFGNP
jgi:hypothetical protein